MAENERFGRRPCQVVEIDQDFCTRTWGDSYSGCLAGPNQNLINNSRDLQDVSLFTRGGTVTDAGLGIDGVSEALDVDLSENLVANFTQVESNAAPLNADVNTLFFAIDFKLQSGDPAAEAELFFIIFYAGGGTTSGGVARFEVGTGDLLQVPGTATVQDLSDGWKRLIGSRVLSGFLGPEDQVGISLFARGGTGVGRFSRPQVTIRESTEYAITTGSPARGLFAEAPCFNTRSTCQDPANYDKGVQVLKFVEKQSPIPTDDYYRPSVKARGVRVTPAKLNPGGADRNARALGQRASLSVSFQDHPDNDRIVDKYRADRDYDPNERGTFWTKWRARNPYYMQRPLRLRSGYLVGGQLVDEITREFVITGFSGPDNQGNVTIQGKDVLTLAEDEKAQAPIASRGKLAASITAGATSATLTPAGIGDSEYPASGEIRIGKEVISFTRTGDNLTLTRGQFGTEAKAHDEDDTVQLCLRYVSEAPQDILYDLLLNYANIPASYLDKAQWDAEALDFLPRLYSAIITEPNGVSQLISEMCQQMYFTIWWDERLGKVLLKSVRLAQEDEVFELDDSKHLVADSVSWKDLSDELITQVWVYYGQLDPTEKLDQGSNYATIAITADPSAEGADKHNLRRIKTIFSRWIDATNASAAEDLGQRILNRYGNAPRQVTFKVDAKDSYLWLGNYIRLTNRLRVDQFGQVTPVNLQIFQAEETSLGSEFQFTAQEFIPALIGGDQVEDPDERVIPITSDLLNVNLRTLHDSLFGAPEGSEKITFVIREGVTIGGDAAGGGVNVPAAARVTVNDVYAAGASQLNGVAIGTLAILQRRSIGSARTIAAGAAYDALGTADHVIKEYPASVALDTGAWPSGVSLSLVVEGGARILGEGGNGSAHGLTQLEQSGGGSLQQFRRTAPGGDGGDALKVQYTIQITNGGAIYGGGGGGACIYAANPSGSNDGLARTPGGGGAGFRPSSTANLVFAGANVFTFIPTYASTRQPSGGGATVAGQGGRWSSSQFPTLKVAQEGGSGGGVSAPGGEGYSKYDARQATSGSFIVLDDLGTGGLAGRAVRSGAASIEWVNKGDVRGDEVA